MTNVANFIEKLTEAREHELVSVDIPSINKPVNFYPLNVKQQKLLLRHSIDGASGMISVLKEMNSIIIDNCVDKTVNFLTVDKYPVLLALRQQAIGNEITINGKQYNIDDLPKSNSLPQKFLTKALEYKDFKVELKLPSLIQDNNFLVKTISETAKLGEDKVKETLTTMYVYEIAKFITIVAYGDIIVDFDTISIGDKKQIVENLPMRLNQKILNFISSVRELENKFITFADNTTIPINTLFLSTQ